MMARKVMAGASGVPITSPNYPDLIAMFTKDNISGATLVNETGNTAYDGTITGATAVSGKIDNALTFNNPDDGPTAATHYVTIPNFTDGITEISCCTWVKKDISQQSGIVIGDYKFSTNKRQFAIIFGGALDNYRLDLIVSGNGTGAEVLEWNSGASLASGTYYFVYVHFIGSSELAISVDNGTLYTQATSITSLFNTSGAPMVLGAGWPAATDGLKLTGDVDQTRFFNRSLTAAERTDLYNGGTGA